MLQKIEQTDINQIESKDISQILSLDFENSLKGINNKNIVRLLFYHQLS